MRQQLRAAICMLIGLTVLTGVVYPLVITGISQVLFPQQANGSLITRRGVVVGSELIGQSFNGPEYFWGRLSATGPGPYNGGASSGSNYGPMHPALSEAVQARISALGETSGSPATGVPVDLVTASGSGLDPHISPTAAEYQVHRVAAARNLPEDIVRDLVREHTTGRQFGILGEPCVNVLLLNLALDARDERN